MELTRVELNAYRLIFRNDTTKQVRQALYDIGELEMSIPDELMADIIAMVRHRGVDAVRELAWPIHKILGKTQSMALYEVAAELGLSNVVLTGPADTGILESLCSYPWPRHERLS